jgi:hypothetical protein
LLLLCISSLLMTFVPCIGFQPAGHHREIPFQSKNSKTFRPVCILIGTTTTINPISATISPRHDDNDTWPGRRGFSRLPKRLEITIGLITLLSLRNSPGAPQTGQVVQASIDQISQLTGGRSGRTNTPSWSRIWVCGSFLGTLANIQGLSQRSAGHGALLVAESPRASWGCPGYDDHRARPD